ncbi:hypothetical protein ACHIPZ_12545 [Antrihabitans sp. NCIMB 15449]|jgi:hypothetical protein|uniref:Heavy metal-binding domain-containing protein n=1 Tax=Antrihabitans spumae TaxID=3373370 RepID=A0ABW7JM34_9NOCA
MRTQAKLGLYGAGLVAVLGIAFGVGSLVGEPTETAPAHTDAHGGGHDAAVANGTVDTRNGYTLGEISAPADAGVAGQLSFRILDASNDEVTAFDTLHEKQLHLIIVKSDTSQYRHLHPTLTQDGTWTVDWTWPTGGSYRVFADFAPTGGGGQVTLGRTLEISGPDAATPLPGASTTAVVDDYTVTLDGQLSTDGGPLTFTVTRAGEPVRDLEPYLGANGHLVALRATDLAYLHVHPEEQTDAGPDIAFHAQAISADNYRLFLEFKHAGVVRTAAFTTHAHGEHS